MFCIFINIFIQNENSMQVQKIVFFHKNQENISNFCWFSIENQRNVDLGD